ncbi:MAG TPA: ABC transporter ATP-binding protein [Candidatus Saccharimonadales bacterium]|nr:ABC transporter ATP-binding protein [Candidatus Saccharimonadales bacterium]
MAKSVIKTENLTKYYGKNLGVESLNLEIKEGEVFGYLGLNGAGKTTTIRLFLNFINPSSGNVSIFGLDPTKESHKLNDFIGYLPGEVHLYERLSGRDHLKYQASLRNKVDWSYVETLADRFNANLHKPIRSLSHGNKQKIALIAAFMVKPKLLILDEPTTGLDPLIQREFYNLVAEVNKEGTTVFISSHILPEVERICHRVGIIRSGNLVVTEDIENLKKKAIRPIEVHFTKAPKVEIFQKIPGINNPVLHDNILRANIKGTMDPLIKELAKYEVENLITAEPDLEQIFLNYYSGVSDA